MTPAVCAAGVTVFVRPSGMSWAVVGLDVVVGSDSTQERLPTGPSVYS